MRSKGLTALGLGGLLLALVFATPADAAQRYAAPAGSGTAPCTSSAAPCTLASAVAQAQPGDEVIVAAGNYSLNATVQVYDFTLRGADPGHPPVLDALGVGSSAQAVSLGGPHPSLANVKIINTQGTIGLYSDVGGDVTNVTVIGSSDTECWLVSHQTGAPGLMQNVTCVTNSTHASAVAAHLATLNGWGPLFVRNCTFVATNTTDAVAFDGPSISPPPITITNSIVLGEHQAASTFLNNANVVASQNWMYDVYPQVSSDGTDIFEQLLDLNVTGDGVRERADSITVDAGSVAGASPSGVDSEGDFRSFGRAPDIGADEVTSPPGAVVSPPSAVGSTSATLHGTAVTGGESASHHFEYGRTAAYGSSTGDVTLPGANGQTPVSFAVTGLPAQSSIHYRLVVSTRDGTARSGDQEFSDVVPPPNNNHPGGAGSGGSAKLRNVAIVKHTLHFTLSRAVKLTVRIQRVVTGHKRHATCSTRIKHGPRCTIVTSVWSKTVRLGAGADKLGLPTLTKGSYRLTLTPAGGKPITRTLSVK